MKKILIISDSEIGNHFIERVVDTYTSDNIYYVVQMKASVYENANPARFKFYEFDPTSLYKLANLLKMEFVQVLIAMDNLSDVENTIKNIRAIKKQLRIIVLDQWNIKNKDSNVVYVKEHEIMASRLLDYLPNVPVIAQNVGLGEGEIMEVLVPFGSSFVYRHIGVIEQNRWRIVAIYRNRELMMPSSRRMIHPNDLLLLVGEPSVLKSVYRAIKRELGQFPEPFGSNLYLYVDMSKEKPQNVKDLLRRALFIHKNFKHKLYIKVYNPGDIDLLRHIKKLRSDSVTVDIDYSEMSVKDAFHTDVRRYHIGLVMVSKDIFKNNDTRSMLYDAHVPVLKIANRSFSKLKDALAILTENRDLEKVSSTIFDISSQMGFNLELFNYTNEKDEYKEQVIEHFNNLATIFSKSIKITESGNNPIRELKEKENFLQVLPFTKKMVGRQLYSLFSTDSERLYYKLDEYHQIFIPVQL
ncbi:TrkA C-terminal domain-containing protein [Sulfurimonas sp. HSL-1716]|uniref:COG3400 family protein n=1 Tax=Hydrocurvibacter sulfurireducens TaxID=3131937 RepID=UPI0031F9996D